MADLREWTEAMGHAYIRGQLSRDAEVADLLGRALRAEAEVERLSGLLDVAATDAAAARLREGSDG